MRRVLSLFSGGGSFDLGFEQAGWTTTQLCEFDHQARQVLEHHWPNVRITNDVRGLSGAEAEPAELVMFGSPCQDVSVSGKRGGMVEGSGTRSSLFFEAIRIIREMREATNGEYPKFALWENVPGSFSSNGGRDFAAVVQAFLEVGARDVCWRVLDAQYFGVAQRRRRVFLVADFAGERAEQILFEPESRQRNPEKGRKPGAGITGALTGGAGSSSCGNVDDNRAQAGFVVPVLCSASALKDGVTSALTASMGHHGHSSPRGDGSDNLVVASAPTYALDARHSVAIPEMSGTLQAKGNKGGGYSLNYINPIAFECKGTQVQHGEVSPTLRSCNVNEGTNISGGGHIAVAGPLYGVRRLTPLECERLQGMPDGHTDVGLSDSVRYRIIGNAGAVPVLRWIAERMSRSMEASDE